MHKAISHGFASPVKRALCFFAVLIELRIEVLIRSDLYRVFEHKESVESSRCWRLPSRRPVQITGHETMSQAPRVVFTG